MEQINDNYTPQIIDDEYVLFAARLDKCPICGKLMVKKLTGSWDEQSFFPNYLMLSQNAQVERAGLVYSSKVTAGDKLICIECEKKGEAYFICDICKQQKPTSKLEKAFGYSHDEHLCTDCYETVPAKQWDDKVDEIMDNHIYD